MDSIDVQQQENDESDMEEECSDNDCVTDFDYYNDFDQDMEPLDPALSDPEYFEFECLREEQVERLLNESVEELSNNLEITPSLAKVLLHSHDWVVADVIAKYQANSSTLLVSAKVKPSANPASSSSSCSSAISNMGKIMNNSSGSICKNTSGFNPGVKVFDVPLNLPGMMGAARMQLCMVCVQPHSSDKFHSLSCDHAFCRDCWVSHFEVQIRQGISTAISCMARDCTVLAPEDFVLRHLNTCSVREKYQQFTFQDYVKSHPQLRFCPGPNCPIVIRSKENWKRAKRALCDQCKTVFCFQCGMDYHAPTNCLVIKKWLTKCADDSETANYISAHTKDCPKCHICIEKNGGCNHMQCYHCKHDFCWMCLGDWKQHGSEYYECSRYKENPNVAHESVHAQAREALRKYLHYYERWENHSKSLKLEAQTVERLREKINQKVMSGLGTWIDWQYLFTAASLLAKCRYTLQYTYPYAYYMEVGPRKELFEYQQSQLEAEIENLSWKIERAETTDRGDLENQMDIAEKRRTTLLKDFNPEKYLIA